MEATSPLGDSNVCATAELCRLVEGGSIWIDVNRVMKHFASLPWVPKHVVTSIAVHRVNGQVLTELRDNDLRTTFHISDLSLRERILQHIQQLQDFTWGPRKAVAPESDDDDSDCEATVLA